MHVDQFHKHLEDIRRVIYSLLEAFCINIFQEILLVFVLYEICFFVEINFGLLSEFF